MAGFFGHIIKNRMIDDMRMEELVPAIKERLDESGHTTIAGDLLPIIIEIVAMESEFYTLSLEVAVVKVRYIIDSMSWPMESRRSDKNRYIVAFMKYLDDSNADNLRNFKDGQA